MKENSDTYNFEYWPDGSNEFTKPVRLSFDTNYDIDFKDFCGMCKAFAYALGYASETIDRYFRED